jgi:hypothetical protein
MSELASILRNIFGHSTPNDILVKKGISEIISKKTQLSKREYGNTVYKTQLLIYSALTIILVLTLIYLMFTNK